MHETNNLACINLRDLRVGLARLIEEARRVAWDATCRDEHRGLIPVTWLVGHVEHLHEIDRAVAILEREQVAAE